MTGLLLLTRHPAAANRKDLTYKTIGVFTTEIGGELRIFFGAHQAPQRHFAFQALLEAGIGLNIGREIGGIVHEILGDGIDLDVVGRDFDAEAWT